MCKKKKNWEEDKEALKVEGSGWSRSWFGIVYGETRWCVKRIDQLKNNNNRPDEMEVSYLYRRGRGGVDTLCLCVVVWRKSELGFYFLIALWHLVSKVLQLARSPAVQDCGLNLEYTFHLLHKFQGNFEKTLRALLHESAVVFKCVYSGDLPWLSWNRTAAFYSSCTKPLDNFASKFGLVFFKLG